MLLQSVILRKVNTLLLGLTGVGKTELVSNIAAQLGLPLTIFDIW
jgi:MoxR-like ATPase